MTELTLKDFCENYTFSTDIRVHDSYDKDNKMLFIGSNDELPAELGDRRIENIFPYDRNTLTIYLW